MTRLLLTTCAVLALCLSVESFADENSDEPTLLSIPFIKAFVPPGFDSNDLASFMVSAELPNTCFKMGPFRFHTDAKAHQVHVHQQAYRYRGLCLPFKISFGD